MPIFNHRFASMLLVLAFWQVSAEEQVSKEEQAPHQRLEEEIVVTAVFDVTSAETAMPVGLISGDELLEKASDSLGESLQNEIGIWNASFGTSVGHPVIRGQSGNRVQILQNGVGVTDAANASQDHSEGVETFLADRLEVVRGPATLLYGNGAVGGVINVIDDRIPQSLQDRPGFRLEQSHSTVNSEDRSLIRLSGSLGKLALRADAFYRESGRVSIPGYAIDTASIAALDELREEIAGHEEDEHDEHEDAETEQNSRGKLANSSAEANGGTLGLSYVTDRGFLGFSFNRLTNNYGLPPGVHQHEEEEAHEEEGEDEQEDEHGHEEVDFVRIDLEKTRYDLRGRLLFDHQVVKQANIAISYTDYQHREIEFLEDGDQLVGTLFANKGIESRATLEHEWSSNWSGVLGMQYSDTDFSAQGEEAFIPASNIRNLGLFLVERYTGQQLTLEAGVRADRNAIDSQGDCDSKETAISLSGSLLYPLTEATTLVAGLSRSERTPSVEELFSNTAQDTCARYADDEQLVLHAATAQFEIGAPDLDKEVSSNVDLSLRYNRGSIQGELGVYRNAIKDYIFLRLLPETQDGMSIAAYQTEDTIFTGVEAEVSTSLWRSGNTSLALTLFGDLVRAEFDSGEKVPQIPPARLGAGLQLNGNNWTAHLHVTRAMDQKRTSTLELPTEGYTQVSFYADYHWSIGDRSELQLFLRARNLLDEPIRNHVSLVRNFAPEPGRGLTLGLRFRY